MPSIDEFEYQLPDGSWLYIKGWGQVSADEVTYVDFIPYKILDKNSADTEEMSRNDLSGEIQSDIEDAIAERLLHSLEEDREYVDHFYDFYNERN